jgi:hypothetical protein
MAAAPADDLHGRGAPRLLRHFAVFDRLAEDREGSSGRLRLERELGSDLAAFLVGALARPGGGAQCLCA